MSLKDLLQSIHNSEALKLCKISPAYREHDRKIIAQQTEEFLQAGNKITVIPNNLVYKKAA